MNLQSNTVFDPDVGVIGHQGMLYHVYILSRYHVSYAPANLKLPRPTVLKKKRFQEKTYLTFDLGPTKCCPVSYIQLQRLKLLRLMVQEKMHLHKKYFI